jgi:hypothetical protein
MAIGAGTPVLLVPTPYLNFIGNKFSEFEILDVREKAVTIGYKSLNSTLGLYAYIRRGKCA